MNAQPPPREDRLRLLTIEQVARFLGTTVDAIYRLRAAEAALPAIGSVGTCASDGPTSATGSSNTTTDDHPNGRHFSTSSEDRRSRNTSRKGL